MQSESETHFQSEQLKLLIDLSTIGNYFQNNIILSQTITKLIRQVITSNCIITNKQCIFETFLKILTFNDISKDVKDKLSLYMLEMSIF
jgi:hypothetical protein